MGAIISIYGAENLLEHERKQLDTKLQTIADKYPDGFEYHLKFGPGGLEALEGKAVAPELQREYKDFCTEVTHALASYILSENGNGIVH